MKTNFFGEPIAEPGDDIFAMFVEAHDADLDIDLTAREIDDDPNFGWSCSISDADGNELAVQGFKSEADLRAALTAAKIEID